jgi:hypothetical protein
MDARAARCGSARDRIYRKLDRDGRNGAAGPFFDELSRWVFINEDFLRTMVVTTEGSDRNRHSSNSRKRNAVHAGRIRFSSCLVFDIVNLARSPQALMNLKSESKRNWKLSGNELLPINCFACSSSWSAGPDLHSRVPKTDHPRNHFNRR